jgi:hypothetical protein
MLTASPPKLSEAMLQSLAAYIPYLIMLIPSCSQDARSHAVHAYCSLLRRQRLLTRGVPAPKRGALLHLQQAHMTLVGAAPSRALLSGVVAFVCRSATCYILCIAQNSCLALPPDI